MNAGQCPTCNSTLSQQDGVCPRCLAQNLFSTAGPELEDEIAGYHPLQLLGEGGFAKVYLVESVETGEQLTAKILKAGMDSHEILRRFEAEWKVQQTLDHPHIVSVIKAGLSKSGRPYFLMDYCEGKPIDDYTQEQPLDDRVKLFAQVCRAVNFAHHAQVIHRDLKPANILVVEEDGVSSPRLIDFGIAKALRESHDDVTLFTRHNQWLGTPQYMSPEQASGSSMNLDARSDIYALGAIFYELLVGTPPLTRQAIQSSSPLELSKLITRGKIELPSKKVTSSRDFRSAWDAITMKALAKDPAQRYDAAAEFAKDLEKSLDGKKVSARLPKKILPWALLALVTISVLTVLKREKKEQPAPPPPRVTVTDPEGAHRLYREAVTNLVNPDRFHEAIAGLARSSKLDPSYLPTRARIWHWLMHANLKQHAAPPIIHDSQVTTHLHLGDQELFLLGTADGSLRFRSDGSAEERIKKQRYSSPPTSLAFNPRANVLAIGLENGSLILAKLKRRTIEELHKIPARDNDDSLTQLSFTQSGQHLLVKSQSGHISCYQADSAQHLWSLEETTPEALLTVHPQRDLFAVAQNNKLTFYKVADRKPTGPPMALSSKPSHCQFLPNGEALILCESNGQVQSIEPETHQTTQLASHSGKIAELKFSSDRGIFLTRGDDDRVIIHTTGDSSRATLIQFNQGLATTDFGSTSNSLTVVTDNHLVKNFDTSQRREFGINWQSPSPISLLGVNHSKGIFYLKTKGEVQFRQLDQPSLGLEHIQRSKPSSALCYTTGGELAILDQHGGVSVHSGRGWLKRSRSLSLDSPARKIFADPRQDRLSVLLTNGELALTGDQDSETLLLKPSAEIVDLAFSPTENLIHLATPSGGLTWAPDLGTTTTAPKTMTHAVTNVGNELAWLSEDQLFFQKHVLPIDVTNSTWLQGARDVPILLLGDREDGTLQRIDFRKSPPNILSIEDPNPINHALISPDGNWIWVKTKTFYPRLYHAETGEFIHVAASHSDALIDLAVDFDRGIMAQLKADDDVFRHGLPPLNETPNDFPDLIEALIGTRLTPEENLEPVPYAELRAAQEKVKTMEISKQQKSWLNWLLSQPRRGKAFP